MRTLICLLLVLVGSWSAQAADAVAAPLPKPTPLITNYLADYPKLTPLPAGMPFKRAVKAKITETVDAPWKVHLLQNFAKPIKKGDLIVVDFWAQGITHGAQFEVNIQQRADPYTSSGHQVFTLSDTWEHIVLAGNSVANYPENELRLLVALGYGKQILSLSEINVVNYGQTEIKPEDIVTRLKANDKK